MANPNVADLLSTLDNDTKRILDSTIRVTELNDPDVEDIKGTRSSTWVKIPEVVAVVADLKGSSQLGTGRHDTSTAKIYQSGVEGAVKCLHEYGADFIDIQGDGGFGLFWGELAFERAFCSAVTIRTFSGKFVDRLNSKYGSSGTFPETGYKVGIAADRVLVKTIGTARDVSEQEAVWPGRAVNHAVKCAQSANRHQIVVTDRVWDYFKDNDYVTTTCGCTEGIETGAVSDLWEEFHISHIKDERYSSGYMLKAPWCRNHGAEFSAAIMSGERTRDLAVEVRRALSLRRMKEALEERRAQRPWYPRPR